MQGTATGAGRLSAMFAEDLTPKLVSVLRRGYGWSELRAAWVICAPMRWPA